MVVSRLMSLSTWLSSSDVVVHMVVVVLCRFPHGYRRFMSLSTWLWSSYVVVHMVVVVLCSCAHCCRRLMSSSSYVVVHPVVVVLCRCPHGCHRLVSLISFLVTHLLLSHHTCPLLSTWREVVKLLTYFDHIDFMDVILKILQ
jgi:hypothetical protein